MSLLKEFREFAMRGNVVDLAVGVIIGAAFGKIVSSLVADIIMPPLGLLIGGVDFKQFHWVMCRRRCNTGSHHELWSIYSKYLRFCHRRFCYFLGNQADEQNASSRSRYPSSATCPNYRRKAVNRNSRSAKTTTKIVCWC